MRPGFFSIINSLCMDTIRSYINIIIRITYEHNTLLFTGTPMATER
jgi:hypothetical protein